MIIGLDVGGTHTDVILSGANGLIRDVKIPTDTDDLFHTVLAGFEKITDGIDPKEIKRAVLSTTLTTNAVVQGKISGVGMIVTAGPGLDPACFRTNDHYYVAKGALDHRGREIEPVDEKEILDIAARLKEAGIEHVGVVGKFSARNPDHENRIGRMIEGKFSRIFYGHTVSGNLNFPRRIATTFLNAAVYPLHKDFFEAVVKSLSAKGLSMPVHILKADGGTMSFESSMDFPGQSVLSGPAASVAGAVAFAPEKEDVIVLDIGGTTTDMAVLIDRVPVLEPLGIELGEYKTLIRSLKTLSVGIGGDSAVRVKDGGIAVGPDRKGPAMGFGGDVPTPTDALITLGRITDADRDAAVRGMGAIADALGVTVEEAAERVFDTTCRNILERAEKMVADINTKPVYTIHDILEGYVVRPKRIMVLGAPALHLAEHINGISDYKATAVPKWGVANALGAGLARTTCEVTVFADTERQFVTAPEENYREKVTLKYDIDDALKLARDLLRKKAERAGADMDNFDMEVLEQLTFNMIRGYRRSGRNIRVKTQVRPGLIKGYEEIVKGLG